MKVVDLQQALTEFARLLEASGGKSGAKELSNVVAALQPFRDHTLNDFAKRLGEPTNSSAREPTTTRTRTTTRPARGGASPEEVAKQIRDIYDRAADLKLEQQQVEAELLKLDGLTKEGLLHVADVMVLPGLRGKRVDEIKRIIREAVLDRRRAAQRAEMVNPPPTPT